MAERPASGSQLEADPKLLLHTGLIDIIPVEGEDKRVKGYYDLTPMGTEVAKTWM